MSSSPWERLDAIGRGQHGLVTLHQLKRIGFSADAVARLARAGRLNPVRRQVYRLSGSAPTWHSSALAAVLAAGEGAVLSHVSAGVLWGLLERPPAGAGLLHLTAPGQRRIVGVTAHRRALLPGEVTRRDLIPVTSPELTLLDLAAPAPTPCSAPASRRASAPAETGRMIDEALRRRLTTPERLLAAAQRHAGPGRRSLVPMRAALAGRGIGYDPGANDWERAMDRMWDGMGLPEARRQYRIRVAGGRSYRPDRAIVEARIAVDWNGYGTHGTRSGFDQDSDRRAHLAAAGWFPLDFTSRSDPQLICTTVLAVYRERLHLPGRSD